MGRSCCFLEFDDFFLLLRSATVQLLLTSLIAG